jgi:hypothetical protein
MGRVNPRGHMASVSQAYNATAICQTATASKEAAPMISMMSNVATYRHAPVPTSRALAHGQIWIAVEIGCTVSRYHVHTSIDTVYTFL